MADIHLHVTQSLELGQKDPYRTSRARFRLCANSNAYPTSRSLHANTQPNPAGNLALTRATTVRSPRSLDTGYLKRGVIGRIPIPRRGK
ncbi:hypothetical protein E4U30_005927 [Claviceps sp. LM220 group G6]|nr:hypothetical protein E4U30_005927 [Claviceps sp. LM220 group G6]